MSIMSLFSQAFGANTQQAQQPANQQQTPGAGQPGNIPQGSDNQNGVNPTVPANQQQELTSPLDQFKDIWQPVETNPNQQASGILGNIDPTKVMEIASKTDFSKVISQDTMAKINAGGPEAMNAMMEAMNKIAQMAYGQSALAASKMVEQAATKMQTKFKDDLPGEFKRLNVSENLRNDNPIFQNPAIAPLISAMETQLTMKYPTASATEITKMAKDYIAGVGQAFNPSAPVTNQNGTPAGSTGGDSYDWSKFLG